MTTIITAIITSIICQGGIVIKCIKLQKENKRLKKERKEIEISIEKLSKMSLQQIINEIEKKEGN